MRRALEEEQVKHDTGHLVINPKGGLAPSGEDRALHVDIKFSLPSGSHGVHWAAPLHGVFTDVCFERSGPDHSSQ